MLQAQYYQQALQSYHSGNLKLSIIYLRKLKKWDRKSIELLVDSSYDLWRQLKSSSSDDVEDIEAAQVVQESFVLLLSNNLSNDLIAPWDYIRLSHVYIVQGNLEGAAHIVNLASSKGHMENILIVTQSCFIMNGLLEENEVQRIITFISSALLDLTAKTKTNESTVGVYSWQNGFLPYYYLYIICAAYLQKREIFRHEREKKETMRDFYSLIRDGYFFATKIKEKGDDVILNWYQDHILWLNCGQSLDGGPFLLLAEAFYWESYIRAPLLDVAIEKLIASLRVHGREKDIPGLMARALIENQWNSLSRKTIRQIEASSVLDPRDREWTKMFDAEDSESVKIQCLVRGWILRRRWPEMLPNLQETRRNHFEKMKLADERHEEYLVRYHSALVHRWKQYIEDWKALKWNSAIQLQTIWRMKYRVWMYREMIQRVKTANSNYFILCQRFFVTERMLVMRKWQAHFMTRKKFQAAGVIADFLFLNGYNQKLVKGMNEVMGVLRVWYKHIKRRAWRHWFERFKNRQKKHARVTIRFFLRDVFIRREEKKHEEQLKIVEQAIAAKKDVQFQQNHLPLLRSSFAEWLRKFRDRLKHKAVIQMAYTLQHRLYRKKSKEVVRLLILRRDSQRAFCTQRRHRLLSRIIRPWLLNAFALRLQRFARHALAMRKYRRLKNIQNGVCTMLQTRLIKARKSMLWRWRKFVYLVKREQLRAIRHVLYTFRRVVLKSKLRRMGLRKPKLYHFVHTCHLKMLAAYFRFVRDKAKMESRLKGAQKLLTATYVMSVQRALSCWRQQLQKQHQLQMLRKLFVHQPLDRCFWPGVHVSVEVRSHKGSSQREQQVSARIDPSLKWEFHPWEKFVPAKLHLLNLTKLEKSKAFRSWMAVYRRTQQFRFDGAYYQARLFCNELFETLHSRMVANIQIQTWFRAVKSRRIHWRLQQIVRWAMELHIRCEQKKLYQCWTAVKTMIHRRQRAWHIVTKTFRINVAKQKLNRLRQRHIEHLRYITYIDRSQFQQVFMRRVIQRWVLTYCHRVLLPTYDMNKHFSPKRKKQMIGAHLHPGHHQNHYHSSNFGDDSEHDQTNDDEDDKDLNPRLRKLLKYQKRLQERDQNIENPGPTMRSNSMTSLSSYDASIASSVAATNISKRNKGKENKGVLPNALSRYVSSGIMFFRSELFHRVLQQVKLTQLFVYDETVAPPALHEQEIYFLLQQASVVIIKDWNMIAQNLLSHSNQNYQQNIKNASTVAWMHVCNAFRGHRIIVEGGSLYLPDETDMYYQSTYSAEERGAIRRRRQQFCDYIQDIVQGKRSFYEKELIDRAKWPLTIPTSALGNMMPLNSTTADTTLVMQWSHVCMSHRMVIFISRLFFSMAAPSLDNNDSQTTIGHLKTSNSLESLSESSIQLFSASRDLTNNREASTSAILNNTPSFRLMNKSFLIPNELNTAHSSSSQLHMLQGVVEWSVDVESVGYLGIVLTMMAMETCRFLKRLKLTISSESDAVSPTSSSKDRSVACFTSSDSFHAALRSLSANIMLEELVIRGRMTKSGLLVLQETLQRDFVSLSRLQIYVAAEDMFFAQSIVDVAKMRSYSALKQGVSIFVEEI